MTSDVVPLDMMLAALPATAAAALPDAFSGIAGEIAAAGAAAADPTGALNLLAAGALGALWRASWQGGLAVLGALAVTRLFRRRMPPAVVAAVWWLACARVLVGLFGVAPVELPVLPASMAPAPAAVASAAAQTVSPLTAVIQTGSLGGKKGGSSPAPVPAGAPRPSSGGAPSAPSPAARRVREMPTPATLAFVLWAAGVVCHAGLALRQFRLAQGLVARATPVEAAAGGGDLALRREAARLSDALGLKATPRLLVSDEVAGPLLVGLGQGAPAVLLPAALVQGPAPLSAEELRLVLAHELAHVKRLDPALGLVPALASSLFFFHPLVRLAHREWDVAREAACDAAALEATGGRADRYGSLLVKLGALAAILGGARPAAVPQRVGANGGATLGAVAAGYAALRSRLVFLQQTLSAPAAAAAGPAGAVRRRGRAAGRAALLGGVAVAGLVPWRLVAAPVPAPAVTPAPVTEPAPAAATASPVITRPLPRRVESASASASASASRAERRAASTKPARVPHGASMAPLAPAGPASLARDARTVAPGAPRTLGLAPEEAAPVVLPQPHRALVAVAPPYAPSLIADGIAAHVEQEDAAVAALLAETADWALAQVAPGLLSEFLTTVAAAGDDPTAATAALTAGETARGEVAGAGVEPGSPGRPSAATSAAAVTAATSATAATAAQPSSPAFFAPPAYPALRPTTAAGEPAMPSVIPGESAAEEAVAPPTPAPVPLADEAPMTGDLPRPDVPAGRSEDPAAPVQQQQPMQQVQQQRRVTVTARAEKGRSRAPACRTTLTRSI